MSERNPEAVLAALRGCSSYEDLRHAGIYFHGTCEEFDGDLVGGAYDGVFWTADRPSVAQAYIPSAGSKLMYVAPSSHELDDLIRPSLTPSVEFDWAMEVTGYRLEDFEIEKESYRIKSYRILPLMPRRADFLSHLESLGYQPEPGRLCEIKKADGRMMPADWRLPGRLFIILANQVEFRDPEWSEDGLGYSSHNRIADFERFEQDGYEALHMGDLLQSDFQGNVGHHSYGLFDRGLAKASWISIPAFRHDGDEVDFRAPATPEFEAFMRETAPGWAGNDMGPAPA